MTDITMLTIALRTIRSIKDQHQDFFQRKGGDLTALRVADREAAAELRDFGFTVNDSVAGSSISYKGVRATCTAGLAGAMINWIAAAERRVEACMIRIDRVRKGR